MTITVHPARRTSDDVPPGTWEGTKQDAVLATAQLREVWERKKAGDKTDYGYSEYDAEMANAQLRAFKLAKLILRQARSNSCATADVPLIIDTHSPKQSKTSPRPSSHLPRPPPPPPTAPLPSPPTAHISSPKQKAARPAHKNASPPRKAAPALSAIPPTQFPPPIPPRKASNRLSQSLPPVSVHSRRYSDELSPKSIPLSPSKRMRSASPVPQSLSPRRETPPEQRGRSTDIHSPPSRSETPAPEVDLEELPVLPYRRKSSKASSPMTEIEQNNRSTTPMPDSKPAIPERSPLRTSIYAPRSETPPLKTVKRTPLKRSVSFRFADGLQSSALSRTSTLIYAELSDALKELQRTIGAATVEVH